MGGHNLKATPLRDMFRKPIFDKGNLRIEIVFGDRGNDNTFGNPQVETSENLSLNKNRPNNFKHFETGERSADIVSTASKGDVRNAFLGGVATVFLKFTEFFEEGVSGDSENKTS